MDLLTRSINLKEEAQKKIAINNLLDFLGENNIHLAFKCNATYSTGQMNIGIGVAPERIPGQWMVTLPVDDYETVALVCLERNGDVHRFIFSKEFYEKIKGKLSRDSNGQWRFTIIAERGIFSLKLPNYPPSVIDKYEDYVQEL